MAFHRAVGGRALGAPRACQLQPHIRNHRITPLVLPLTAEPRPTLSLSPEHANQPLATPPTGQELAATAAQQCTLPRSAPPSHQRSPAAPWSGSSSSATSSSSARRRHIALSTERRSPASLSTAAANRLGCAIKGGPRAQPRTQAASHHSARAPLAVNRRERVIFFLSGNSCRRHCPSHSGATRSSLFLP